MLEAAVYTLSSFWFGALHAATPGHGKTVAVAYLVGARGRLVDAITLGVVVTLSHTLGIVLFGVVATLGSAALLPRVLEQYIALGTGLVIVAIGICMLWSQRPWLLERLSPHRCAGRGSAAGVDALDGQADLRQPLPACTARALRVDTGAAVVNTASASSSAERLASAEYVDMADPALAQTRSGRGVDSEDGWHRHGVWGHRHSHGNLATINSPPPSLRLLVGLGVAGGVMPDPGALAVLLSALSSGRLVLGLVTVLVFSLGFATVLVLAGLVAGRAGALVLERKSGSRWVEWLRFASALVITVYGVVLVAGALRITTSLA
jgi:nickel/cobalt exporter